MTLNQFIYEFEYNETWLFLQSRYYDISFFDMQNLVVSGINEGNHSDKYPLNGETIDPANIFFETNQNSRRVKNCWMIKIQLTRQQYLSLVLSHYNNQIR